MDRLDIEERSFYSILVRLKAQRKFEIYDKVQVVSIPYWFD